MVLVLFDESAFLRVGQPLDQLTYRPVSQYGCEHMSSEPVYAQSTAERRARAREQRRSEIIDAAMEVWAIKGSRGTGITEVAQRAGMTHAGLLHHFGNKNNLRLAVMQERDRRDRSVMEKWYLLDDIGVVWEHFPDVACANERQIGLAQLFVSLLGENVAPGSIGYNFFQERYATGVQRIAGVLSSAKSKNRIDESVRCDRIAADIYAFMDGALIQWLLDPQEGLLVERYTSYFAGLADDIGLRPA